MVVGTAKIDFRLFDVFSLKDKRRVIKPIISRTRNKFNISIAETDFQDSLEKARIGFSITSNHPGKVNSMVDKAINFIDGMGLAMITDTQIEIISL